MPSRRRQLREKKKVKTKNFGLFAKILLPLILFLIVLLFFLLNTKYWNGKDKFIFVSKLGDGGAEVTVLDPRLSEEINLIIPGETEVAVARNLGTLQLRNVWQLGINENLGGGLAAETISRNFLFPVFLWRDDFGKTTNIPLGDVLLTKIFLLGVKPINKIEVHLGKSQFLTKVKLNDGTSGYRLTGPVSGAITAYFSDNDFANRALRIGIADAAGRAGVAQRVGEIIEVMGGKIVSISKIASLPEVDCLVSGKDPKAVRKIANLFSCRRLDQETDFDIEVKLGGKFSKRF